MADPEPIGVFVLTLRATAGPANSQPDGRRYTILAFAKGDTEAVATDAAFQGLDALGWIEGETLRCGEIVAAGRGARGPALGDAQRPRERLRPGGLRRGLEKPRGGEAAHGSAEL